MVSDLKLVMYNKDKNYTQKTVFENKLEVQHGREEYSK